MKTKEYLLHDGPEETPEESTSTRATTFTRQLSNLSSCSSVGRDSSSRPGSPQQHVNPRQQQQQQQQQKNPSNKQRLPQTIESHRKMAKSQPNTSPPQSPPPKKTTSSTNLKVRNPSTPNRQTKSAIETQYLAKKKGFVYLMKDLAEKQKHILEVHAAIKELRNKVLIETGKDLELPEEIKLIDIENIKVPQINLPEKVIKEQPAGGENARQVATPLCKLPLEMHEKMGNIQQKYLELCNHLLSRRQALMDWLLTVKESYGIDIDNASVQESLEFHIKEGESLKLQQEETIAESKSLIDQFLKDIDTNFAKAQESAIEKQESIKQLTTRLQAALKENKKLNELLQLATKQIECNSREIQTLRKSKTGMEEKLKSIHGKLKEMDTKSDTSEKSVRELEEKNKNLEIKLRNTEKNNDLKLREANKRLNACNARISKLESEKRILEEKVLKHKHEVDMKNAFINKLRIQQEKLKQKTEVDDEAGHIKDLKNHIDELQSKTEKEISEKDALIQSLQNSMTDIQQKMQEEISVRVKTEKECKNQKQLLNRFHQRWEKLQDIMETFFDTTVCKHSSLEKSLWKKLQSTKRQLSLASIQNEELAAEQQKFMELFKRAAENKDTKSVIENIHQMVSQKDEVIKKLKQETFHLKALSKRSKEQLMIMKHQLLEHQKIISSLSDRGAISEEMKLLSAQVGDLRTTLAEVLSHNEELRQALISKQIMADQSTKLVLEQQKVQEDLCNIIQGKEKWPEEEINLVKSVIQGGEKTINELIRKEQLEMLNEMMQSKEEQVMKLENLVKQLKEHQEHCQQQRVQYEARIALLMEQVQQRQISCY